MPLLRARTCSPLAGSRVRTGGAQRLYANRQSVGRLRLPNVDAVRRSGAGWSAARRRRRAAHDAQRLVDAQAIEHELTLAELTPLLEISAQLLSRIGHVTASPRDRGSRRRLASLLSSGKHFFASRRGSASVTRFVSTRSRRRARARRSRRSDRVPSRRASRVPPRTTSSVSSAKPTITAFLRARRRVDARISGVGVSSTDFGADFFLIFDVAGCTRRESRQARRP